MPGPPTQGQLDAIARRIHPRASVLRSWPLAGGVSAATTAFEVAEGEGATRRYVLRQPPGWSSAGHEQRLLSLVQGRGVAVPVLRLLGEAGDVLEDDWLVLDYADGEPYFGPDLGPRRATAMAEALAAIHRHRHGGIGLQLPTGRWRWADATARRLLARERALAGRGSGGGDRLGRLDPRGPAVRCRDHAIGPGAIP